LVFCKHYPDPESQEKAMKKPRFFRQPYFLLILTAAILFILSFFHIGRTVYFASTNFYSIVPEVYFYWGLVLFFLLFWSFYTLTGEFLWTSYLTWLHVLVTIIVFALLMTIHLWHDLVLPPAQPFRNDASAMDSDKREVKVILPIVLLFAIGQVSFLANILVGLIRTRPKSNPLP
jgi:hypothetical protein